MRCAAVPIPAVILFMTALAGAQSQTPQPPGLIRRGPATHQEPQAPLLTLNVVALDLKGQPAGGLQQSDVRLYDDGKLMQVAFCRPLNTAGPSTALGPGEYSNRPVRGSAQTVVVLLDLLNENLSERGLGWNEVAHTFQKLDNNQRVYVYLLTAEGTIHPVHPIPAAGDSRPPDLDWAAKVPALLDQAIRDVARLKPQEYRVNVDSRVRKSIDLLKDVASDLGAQPGRKSLVWVSHGIPSAATSQPDGLFREYTPLIQDLGSNLARAGIMLYAVNQNQRDTQGLMSEDTLRQLANMTGGQWLPTDRTEDAIQQAIAEAPAVYRVGYIPPLEKWDNKFHKLRITAEGKNLRLRAPQGYFGDARVTDPRDRFTLAATGQTDASDIGIQAAVTPSQKINSWLHFQVRVDASDLQLTAGDLSTGEFGVTFGYYTTEWESNTSAEVRTSVKLTKENREAILHDGVDLSYERPLPEGVHKIRLVVRDTQSGAVGSLTVPVGDSAKE